MQRTSILPKSSIADSRLTTTLFFASLKAPRDRENVVTSGSASGITVTARAIEKIRSSPMSARSPLIIRFAANTNASVTTVRRSTNALNLPMAFSNVLRRSRERVTLSISPTAVSARIATTIPRPSPLTIALPENPMFCAPYISTTAFGRRSAILKTGADSPVKADSSTIRCSTDIKRTSAYSASPGCARTTSPTTSSQLGTIFSLESRITRERVGTYFCRNESARSERCS